MENNNGRVYKLQQVQILTRHGARTPVTNLNINDFPNYEEATWDLKTLGNTLKETDVPVSVLLKNGEVPSSVYDKEYKQKGCLKGGMLIGKLTSVGQNQSYNLGKKLREKYDCVDKEFLSSHYDPLELNVRTSDLERTIISARCFVTGLYGKDNISEPIKMYTMKASREFIYPNWFHCETLKGWKQQIDYIHCLPDVHMLTKQMNELLGITDPKQYMDLVAMDDLICCRKTHGFSIPEKLKDYEEDISRGASEIFTLILQGKDKLKGLRSCVGDLLNELCGNLENSKDKEKTFKMKLYSTHDSSLMSLLMVFNQWKNNWPLFASYIIFEHYKDQDSNDYVNVVFNGEELKLNERNEKYIQLDRFLEQVNSFRVRDPKENFS